MSAQIPNIAQAGAACLTCRRRKVRCDQGLPSCGTCTRNRTDCEYEARSTAPRPVRFVPFDTSRIRQSVEPSAVPTTEEDLEPTQMITLPLEQLEALEYKIDHLARLVKSLRHQPNRRSEGLPGADADRESPSAHKYGHLSTDQQGQVRYVERTFWASICDQVVEIDSVLRYDSTTLSASDTGQPDPFVPPNDVEGDIFSDSIYAEERPDQMTRFARWRELLLQELPLRSTCDFLVRVFMSGYQPIAPILEAVSFHTSYQNLQTALGQPGSLEQEVVNFIPLFVAVLYAGAAICPLNELHEITSRSEGISPASFVHKLYRFTIRTLRQACFPRAPTVETLSAYVLCQGTWLRQEQPLDCCTFVGLAVQTAYTLGLHRDPERLASVLPHAIRTRRLVWWHIVHIDAVVSLGSGLPPLIDLKTSDVLPLNDSLIDPIAETETVLPHRVLLMAKMQSIQNTRRFLINVLDKRQLKPEEINQMINNTKQLERAMNTKIQLLRRYLLEPNHEAELRAIAVWSVDYVRVLICRSYILLYPFIDQHKARAPKKLRDIMVTRSIEMLLRVVRMSCLYSSRYFEWSWPGNHQPLHEITILLKEILDASDTYDYIASCNAIEAISALFCPGQGLVGGPTGPLLMRPLTSVGKRTWEQLSKLKRMAWDRIGYARIPDWTREEALKYAITLLQSIDEDNLITVDVGVLQSETDQRSGELLETSNIETGTDPQNETLGLDFAEWLTYDFQSPEASNVPPQN